MLAARGPEWVLVVEPSLSPHLVSHCRCSILTITSSPAAQISRRTIVARLWKLATNRNTANKVDTESVQTILLAMARFPETMAITVAGLAAIEASGVLQDPEAAQILVDAHGANLVANQMKRNKCDPACQEYGSWILGSLGYLGFGENVEFADGVVAVAAAIHSHKDNSRVIRNATRALDGLSQQTSENATKDGRLEAFLSVLRSHQRDSTVVKTACGGVANLIRVLGEAAAEVEIEVELVEEGLSLLELYVSDAEMVHGILMMLGTVLYAKRADAKRLAPIYKKIQKAVNGAFESHLTSVKIKQSVAWVQAQVRERRGSQSLIQAA